MKSIVKTVRVVAPLLLILGCGEIEQPSNETIKGGEVVVDFSATQMKQTLISKGFADENTTVFGYKAYKIPYTTTDEEGNEVEVSGLFVIPTGMPESIKQIGLSMVSDDHGTIFANADAPSVIATNSGTPDGSSIILSSLGGFATLQPDYIGFGDSYQKHYHPFILKKSLANCTVDFIKAVKKFASENGIKLNDQLFLTGYSEGGYASMATLQKIEADGELSVTMAIPMAGPYDLNRTAFGVLSQPKLSVPSFMANVAYSYAKAYDKKLSTILNQPYANKLPALIDGSRARDLIDPELSYDTTGESGLFNPIFIGSFFADSNFWFRKAMVENSVHAWVPQTPVRLVQCQGDDVIPFVISEITQKTMKAMGATDVELVPVEPTLGLDYNVTHSDCGHLAYRVTTNIFSSIRKATVGY